MSYLILIQLNCDKWRSDMYFKLKLLLLLLATIGGVVDGNERDVQIALSSLNRGTSENYIQLSKCPKFLAFQKSHPPP